MDFGQWTDEIVSFVIVFQHSHAVLVFANQTITENLNSRVNYTYTYNTNTMKKN